jgi:hypothetical protein
MPGKTIMKARRVATTDLIDNSSVATRREVSGVTNPALKRRAKFSRRYAAKTTSLRIPWTFEAKPG